MNHIILVLNHISNADNFFRHWNSEECRFFFECLSNKGIKYEVYAEYAIDVVKYGFSWATKIRSFTIEQVKSLAEKALQNHETVFFISDSTEAVTFLSEKEGCLPFLLSEKDNPDFESDKYIKISSLSCLNVYFEGPLPRHLLLTLRHHEEFKSQIEMRNARIKKQIQTTGGIYIFGANTIGKQVYSECTRSKIKVLGFVDNDLNKQKTTLYGLPIFGPSHLCANRDVIILASGNYSYDIYKHLESLSFEYIQNLSEFFYACDCPTQPEPFFHHDLWYNRMRYHVLYLMLADSASRKVLEAIIQHRQDFELLPLAQICDKQNLQWFDKTFFIPNPDHVFVDGGGFDGDTALSFISVNGNDYRAIHVFEVDSSLVDKATENLKDYDRTYIYNCGLSNKKGTLLFDRTGFMDGHFSEEDGVPVRIDSVDNMINNKITFLKLDIEGAEENAIAGAADHISKNSPLLSIAVYHRAKDLWAIPSQILSINSDYLLYLRHYTQVAYETVLYGLPNIPYDQ